MNIKTAEKSFSSVFLTALYLIVCCVPFMLSCQSKEVLKESSTEIVQTEEPIVGKWKNDEGNGFLDFLKDGTFSLEDPDKNRRMTGKYQMINEDTMKMTFGAPKFSTDMVKYKISGNDIEFNGLFGSPGITKLYRF